MKSFLFILSAAVLACLTGCASVEMHGTSLVAGPNNGKALVNFVRPSIFAGDGTNIDIWDGETYIGSLGAGKLIQHEVSPGKHLFMSTTESVSYVSGDLEAGKQYYLKANTYPGFFKMRAALGVVKKDDQRVSEWLTKLSPSAAAESDRNAVAQKKTVEIKEAIAVFESGQVSSFATIEKKDAR